MRKHRYLAVVVAALLCAGRPGFASEPAAGQATEAAARERLVLDRGWRFHLGDISFPVVLGMRETYLSAKAGNVGGAAAPDYDDSDWRQLDLPHDWAVEGPFDPDANLAQGYRPRGVSWYRRSFELPEHDAGRHLELQFDGVATHCTVWVNGVLAHRNWSAYTSFYVDITPFAKYGDEPNTIVVRVDANPMEGWWYEGAGIYRHTWLVKRGPVHVATDGVYANPIRAADGTWTVPVEVTVGSCDNAPAKIDVESTLIDASGSVVSRATTRVEVPPLATSVATLSIAVDSPELWSIDHPTLYEVRTALRRDGAVIDRLVTACGFRSIRFDADHGFFLNDQPVKLKGVCNHQDHAGVGVAVPDSLWEFRIRRLKEMGANACRCAHHAPSAEFLDACDRLGMLVMDENRNFNTTPEYMRQLEWLVRRDRNHPSVILWSVFNEEPMQGTRQGYEMARRMAAAVKRLDRTRPVTAAQSNSMLSSVNASQAADVAGFNYQQGEYDDYHAANPDTPITSSEDTSAVMTRGEYETNEGRAVLSSYDTEFQPWGAPHRDAWKAIAERDFVAGGFVWTGFDYHGEPQPLEWPATGSSFGCMDLCGFPKAAYYIRQALWIDDRPILHLIPHWDWPGREGDFVKVMALSNADSVELRLNGELVSEKTVDKYMMASWDVVYEPGALSAAAKKDGKTVATCVVETTGPPVALQLLPDRPILAGDGCDAQPVTVRAIDADGRPTPHANLPVRFEIAGPGAIIGLGNGDPTCHEPEKGDRRSLFNGLAQLIIQTEPDSTGRIVLLATADGLADAEAAVDVIAAPAPPHLPAATQTFVVSDWRVFPRVGRHPSPEWRVSPLDMRAGRPARPGRLQEFREGRFVVYRAQFKPRAAVCRNGGRLVFNDVVGKAQVWIDGRLAGAKQDDERGRLAVPLPPGGHERVVAVVIEAALGSRAGLGGRVTVE